jgi:hypothetical protein
MAALTPVGSHVHAAAVETPPAKPEKKDANPAPVEKTPLDKKYDEAIYQVRERQYNEAITNVRSREDLLNTYASFKGDPLYASLKAQHETAMAELAKAEAALIAAQPNDPDQ